MFTSNGCFPNISHIGKKTKKQPLMCLKYKMHSLIKLSKIYSSFKCVPYF